MNTVDLGTYHVRVELKGIPGFIYEWGTGARFVPGGYGADTRCIGDVKPLSAEWLAPSWRDEADLARAIVFLFTEGNYSCDCNRLLFSHRANQQEDLSEEDTPCGHKYTLERLTVIRPDGSEKVLYTKELEK